MRLDCNRSRAIDHLLYYKSMTVSLFRLAPLLPQFVYITCSFLPSDTNSFQPGTLYNVFARFAFYTIRTEIVMQLDDLVITMAPTLAQIQSTCLISRYWLWRTFKVSYRRMMFGWRSEAMIRASRCRFALTYSSLIFRVSMIFIAT